MFNVLEGGVIEPIKWNKSNFMPEISIIVLDESSETVYLWHGVKQGLVARRTALRQAESLKGHGYTVGKSIIGRDIKSIKEIDARKIGKVPEDTKMNEELQGILDKKITELDNFIVTFQAGAVKSVVLKKEEPKVEVKTTRTPTPAPAATATVSKPISPAKPRGVASEYDSAEPMPSIKPEIKPAPSIKISKTSLLTDAKISFVFNAILDHFEDIWISKKSDGSFAVEQMDGPICQFSIKEGAKLKFTANSFSGVEPRIKTAIQKKFIELSKLL